MEGALVATARFTVDKAAILFELDEKLKAMAGTKRKMEEFEELSKTIDAVIQNLDSRPFIDDSVKGFLKQLKCLAIHLEDVKDYRDTKVLKKKQRSKTSLRLVLDFFSSDHQVVFKLKIGGMIKTITDSLGFILLQKTILLNLSQGSVRTSESNLHGETHSRPSFVIGRETEKNIIVNMLTNDDGDESSHGILKVITIVGMGGLGKTTLAKLVFNDEKVKVHFASARMWKVVGAEFDPKKIMKSVLELATCKPVDISEIDLMMQELEKILSEKKFLLVLDDVWNENASNWDVLKTALTCGARGSKILVTTRSQQVSLIMGSSKTTHQIQPLPREHCLSLFRQFAFGGQAVDQNLMQIGKKIVEKCGGVPLAVQSLGSMLLGVRDENYWCKYVLEKKIWQLSDGEQKVIAVLKLSYDSLPLQSKKCFAFGSLFPKNYSMRKDELIKMWIANGFVRSEGNFEAEIVSNRIFDDLVSRSFFLLAPVQYDPRLTECTMHDLMHDLAQFVSADAYWNSSQDLVENIGIRTYHLQIVEGKLPDMTEVLSKKPSYLRTFVSLMPGYSCSLSINLLKVFSKLKYLRALDLTGCGIKEIPTSIKNLIHLRYLNLYYNNIEVLPDSIILLSNLQYLNLGYNQKLLKLPKELRKMQNLRELDLEMDYKLTHIPRGLSKLTNLQSLPFFIVSDKAGASSITELEDLKLRGEMTIKFSYDFENYSCDRKKVLKNTDLNELHIEFHGSESYHKDMLDDLCPNTSLKMLRITNYSSPQFPTWLMELQLPNLVEVDLHCSHGHIPPFGNLQFLKRLDFSMHGITHLGAEFHGSGGFPSLQELNLSWMDDLEEWSESHGDNELFPSLKWLQILHCPKLKSTPRLPTLRHLQISYCTESILSCIGRLTFLSVLRVDNMYDVTSLPSGCIRNLTSLTELQIRLCPQLQSLPGDEMQYLQMLCSLTIEGCYELPSFPSEVRHISSFRFLRLSQCSNIILQPEELVQVLNSIHQFQIQICGQKVNLHGQLQHLHTLEALSLSGAHYEAPITWYIEEYGKPSLYICCCNELESLMTAEPANNVLEQQSGAQSFHHMDSEEGSIIHSLINLILLFFWSLFPGFESVISRSHDSNHTVIPRLPSVLEELYIDEISNLTTLPDWLQHLKSLRLLSVENCPLLETLPRGLQNLHMLEDLTIVGSPRLENRCKRETGEDWPIISHVRNVDIRSSD